MHIYVTRVLAAKLLAADAEKVRHGTGTAIASQIGRMLTQAKVVPGLPPPGEISCL